MRSTRYIACIVRDYHVWSGCCSVVSFEASYAGEWISNYYCYKSNADVDLESIAWVIHYIV